MRWGARCLLVACAMLLIETACSHAPPPPTRAEIQTYEGTGTVVRFHTISGTTLVTSRYATTDSTIVIDSILRDPKYYRPTEAKLHEQELKPPPKETAFPLEVPLTQIKFIEKWEPRSVKADMAIGGAVVIVVIVAIAVFAAYYFGKALEGFSAD